MHAWWPYGDLLACILGSVHSIHCKSTLGELLSEPAATFTFRVCRCGTCPPQTGPVAPCRGRWACSGRPGWGARCAARPPAGSLPPSRSTRAPWRGRCWCPWTGWGWSRLGERNRWWRVKHFLLLQLTTAPLPNSSDTLPLLWLWPSNFCHN